MKISKQAKTNKLLKLKPNTPLNTHSLLNWGEKGEGNRWWNKKRKENMRDGLTFRNQDD